SVKKRNMYVSTDSVTREDDSLISVPVRVSSLDSAMVKYGQFNFSYDSTVVRFVSATPGALLPGGSLTTEIKPNEGHITFFGADTSKPLAGSGELLVLTFKTLRREDTAC